MARRQAHEALIHRIDAGLTVAAAGGPPPAPVDPLLAADGIDELLRGMLDVGDGPRWGSWIPDGGRVRIVASVDGDVERSWDATLGRVAGRDPSGVERDLVALRLGPSPGEAAVDPDATVGGPAAVVDLWLWGRAPIDDLVIDGDRSVVERLRATAEVT